MGRKDPEYTLILHTVRTGGSIKDLPSESEGARMGGEWSRLDVMDDADIVQLSEKHGVTKIYPPKEYRSHIIDSLHSGGRKSDSMLLRALLHYYWPGMRQAIRDHVSNCRSCFTLQPSKA